MGDYLIVGVHSDGLFNFQRTIYDKSFIGQHKSKIVLSFENQRNCSRILMQLRFYSQFSQIDLKLKFWCKKDLVFYQFLCCDTVTIFMQFLMQTSWDKVLIPYLYLVIEKFVWPSKAVLYFLEIKNSRKISSLSKFY